MYNHDNIIDSYLFETNFIDRIFFHNITQLKDRKSVV